MPPGPLSGVRVVVAGAGLAGLAAARDLESNGAQVTVVEARARIGGRVRTVRSVFAGGQHAEAGADLIEGEQARVRELAASLGLQPHRILREGFGFYGPDRNGRRRVQSGPASLQRSAPLLKREIEDFCLSGQRWDSAIARRLGGMSVADWLQTVKAPRHIRAGMRGMHRAIGTLKYGSATRVLLQFDRAFWRRGNRPRAFGTELPVGAVWDGSEGQRGRHAILSLLAGGRAAFEVLDIIAAEGIAGVTERLRWLGPTARVTAAEVIAWQDEPWSRGGYAYFDPGFDPALRAWLARPAGRLVFAGEHTSVEWQGYMNGALESGQRAAAEIRALAATR